MGQQKYRASQEASQKEDFSLAGPLSLIFSSVKVTASDSSEVTVSMTSGESKNSDKCDSGSHLSSPKLASTKYRQHRSSMPEVTVTSRNAINALAPAPLGVCPDNLLNRKAESAFVQAVGKEKGPAVSQALLSTSMISCTGESNELHHNSHLQATGNLSYSRNVAPQWAARFGSLCKSADRISRHKVRFFYVRNQRCTPIMAGRSGEASAPAGFRLPSLPTPLRLATPFGSGLVRLHKLQSEATTMATTQTRPEFIDTYWIIPEYETTPYGKVSLTRQDRRTFIAMFKDSRLIWAGRQPVSDFTQGLKDPESQKVGVKRSANPTSSTKGTESRLQFNQSPGLLVRKMPHEGIEEISIPQGMVKITTPSTIEEISTVPATVSDIATVQGVAHV